MEFEEIFPNLKKRFGSIIKKICVFLSLFPAVIINSEAVFEIDLSQWERKIFIVEALLSDETINKGYAITVARHLQGTLLITVNNLVRSKDPNIDLKEVYILHKYKDHIRRHQAKLLEMNPHKNVAIIYVEGEVDFPWWAMGCVTEVVKYSKASLILRSENRNALRSIEGTFLERFSNGLTKVQFSERRELILGAPVTQNGGIIGIIIGHNNNTAKVLSINDIVSGFLTLSLPWQMLPVRGCVGENEKVSIEDMRRQRGTLAKIVYKLFVPDAEYSYIMDSLKPTHKDFSILFHPGDIHAAKSHYKQIRSDAKNRKMDDFKPAECDYYKLCNTIEPNTRLKYGDLLIRTNQKMRVTICMIFVGGEKIEGFIFVNNHWIWFPLY